LDPSMGLRQFEQRLERLVEGVFAKTLRSGLEPVEIARRLAREMDLHRAMGVNGMIAPNHFQVAISPSDLKNFESYAQALNRELAEAVREHGRDEGYGFVGPVHVELTPDESLGAGEFLVASQMLEAPGGAAVGSLLMGDGRRVPVGEDPVTLGRLPECDVVLSDPNVSRRHAEVRRRGNDFVVVDLGSTNGTRVNGAGVKERRLNDGDEITVGSTRIRFEAS
ncbi:MAG: FhaA domain-containing protein, partial [Acidimicrobiales bacterium]